MKLWIMLLLIIGMTSSCIFSKSTSTKKMHLFQDNPDTLFVSKVNCNCDSRGYSLNIFESVIKKGNNFCSPFLYNFLYNAANEEKINLIQQLLEFQNDTTIACINIQCYSTSAFKEHGNEFSSGFLNIQVMALYHINLICFAQFSVFKYSPYPVLYDTMENRIVNNEFEKMKEVFFIYKTWFEENKKTNFNSFSFPLIKSRYKWVYGDYSREIIFNNLPVVRSDYKYSIGRPVD